MEKLIAMSELFDVSLDYLMLGKEDSSQPTPSAGSDFVTTMHEKVLTPQNKKRAKSALKIAGIIAGAILLIDAISMIIYFAVNGLPH